MFVQIIFNEQIFIEYSECVRHCPHSVQGIQSRTKQTRTPASWHLYLSRGGKQETKFQIRMVTPQKSPSCVHGEVNSLHGRISIQALLSLSSVLKKTFPPAQPLSLLTPLIFPIFSSFQTQERSPWTSRNGNCPGTALWS